MEKKMKAVFSEVFGGEPEGIWFAPGRVNLIGEHTDYNGGHVFPCALTLGTYAAAKRRTDGCFRFYSQNFPEDGIVELRGTVPSMEASRGWGNYPLGVLKELMDIGLDAEGGIDVAYFGDLPQGAGLSSSASLEILTAFMLKDLFEYSIEPVDMALLCQRVENQYIGVQSGIMDQYVVALGKKDHAMLLDTNALSHRHVPLDLQGYALVIANTNKQRGLKDSKYNERRRECEAALAVVQKQYPIASLGEMDLDALEKCKNDFEEEHLYRRARHAVSENLRTLKAERALGRGDLVAFGRLMQASHTSLREDYEVTGLELDVLQEAAMKQPGVLGSRMTGAGFGGCTVTLLREEALESFTQAVKKEYLLRIGYAPSFYKASVGNGAQRCNPSL